MSAVLIVLGSTLIAEAVVVYGVGQSTFALAVQIFASGSSLALSYLLVVLYRGQQKLLERQLELQKRPEVYVSSESVKWGDNAVEFSVHNDGESTARQLRVEQRIEISRLGHVHNVFDGILTPAERLEEHDGYDDLSGWSPGRRFVKPGQSQSVRVDNSSVELNSIGAEKIMFRLLGISPRIDRFDFSISWYLVYDYRDGESDEALVTSDSYQSDDAGGVLETVRDEVPVPQASVHDDWITPAVSLLCDMSDMSIKKGIRVFIKYQIYTITDNVSDYGYKQPRAKTETDQDLSDDE